MIFNLKHGECAMWTSRLDSAVVLKRRGLLHLALWGFVANGLALTSEAVFG